MNRVYTLTVCIFALFIISTAYSGTLTGKVSDSLTELPVQGARVKTLGFNAGFPDSLHYIAMTGEDGNYTIENMNAGTYVVWCEHPSYFPQKVEEIIIGDDTVRELHFVLNQRNTNFSNHISGQVFSQPPMLPAFIPLPGATVYLRGNGVIYDVLSNDDGFYEFNNILPGLYTLGAKAAGHIPREFIDSVYVAEGSKIENLDIILTEKEPHPHSSLAGIVLEDESEEPVHPAYITLIPMINRFDVIPQPTWDYPEISVLNNPDGTYLIDNIPAGIYYVMCTARGYETEIEREIEFYALERYLEFHLEALDPNETNLVSGMVSNAENQSPITLANVGMVNLDGPEIYLHTYTDGSGYFQFHSIHHGRYQISFYKKGFYPLLDTVAVDEQTWITDLDVFLKPRKPDDPITVWGYVREVDTHFKPVYPAKIEIIGYSVTGDSVYYATQNNPDGSYKIGNIHPGYYTMVCSSEGYESRVYHKVYLHHSEHRIDFYLSPINIPEWGLIAGEVFFDNLGTPVPRAHITFIADNGIYLHTFTNEEGEYKAKLPEGEYIVSCLVMSPDSSYRYQEFYDDVHSIADATPVEVIANSATDAIDFGIPYPAVVSTVFFTGKVTDHEGNPLEEALVRVRQIDLPVLWPECNDYIGYTNDDGNYEIKIELFWFTFPNPPLPFIVSAKKEGYNIEFYKEKSNPHEADILWALSDTTFSDINFTLDPVNLPNSISGTISSENGQLLANAFVIGSSASSGELVFTFTNNQGKYRLGGLKKEHYYLLFAANGHIPEFYDDVRIWEEATAVLAEGEVTGIDASLTPIIVPWDSGGAILAGTIGDDSGKALSSVLVSVYNMNGDVVAYDFTDSEGSYEIGWFGDGQYQVSASKVSYVSESDWIDVNNAVSNINVLNFSLQQTVTGLPGDEDPDSQLPSRIELFSNYPNPFNPTTYIKFAIPQTQLTKLTVYNILGRKIKSLLNDMVQNGYHTISWDGTDDSGDQVSSGIYFYVLEAGDQKLVKKMIFNK
jgi:hypothetical protein